MPLVKKGPNSKGHVDGHKETQEYLKQALYTFTNDKGYMQLDRLVVRFLLAKHGFKCVSTQFPPRKMYNGETVSCIMCMSMLPSKDKQRKRVAAHRHLAGTILTPWSAYPGPSSYEETQRSDNQLRAHPRPDGYAASVAAVHARLCAAVSAPPPRLFVGLSSLTTGTLSLSEQFDAPSRCRRNNPSSRKHGNRNDAVPQ